MVRHGRGFALGREDRVGFRGSSLAVLVFILLWDLLDLVPLERRAFEAEAVVFRR